MNPYKEAETLLDEMFKQKSHVKTPDAIAMAQAYATLALAASIDGLALDLVTNIQTTNAELGAISMALGEK